jgi:hypothetical protein
MAENNDNPRSKPSRQSQRDTHQTADTQQRRRNADSGTPGRDKQSKGNRSARHGEDSADAESRQRDRGNALLRGDESSNIDEPMADH